MGWRFRSSEKEPSLCRTIPEQASGVFFFRRAAPVEILTPLPPLSPQSSLLEAAMAFQRHGVDALPLVELGWLVGSVELDSVMGALEEAVSSGTPPEEVPVASLLRTGICTTGWPSSLEVLRQHLEEGRHNVLFAVAPSGEYLGAVRAASVLAAWVRQARPAMVGGLATPLGVLLTTGHHRGGAGDGALFLTGLLMSGFFLAAHVLLFLAYWVHDRLTGGVLAFSLSTGLALGATDASVWFYSGAIPILVLGLLRASRLSGFHAAEHQAVHALERGLPVQASTMRALPRPHPRCGTNIGVLLFLLTAILVPVATAQPVPLWAVALFPFWRRLGMWLQQWVTTRPATEAELESAARAWRQLQDRYRSQPGYRAPLWRQIWNRGLLQVVAGMAAGMGLMAGFLWLLER